EVFLWYNNRRKLTIAIIIQIKYPAKISDLSDWSAENADGDIP
ncbi:MAG: hypothetical protein K0R19_3478, partial [Bacillota bacterium]|nr:hypothetical protein [Bacillota bacterium]